MSARTGFASTTLVLGEEELLADRAVADAVAAARDELGPETTVEEVQGGSLPDGFAMGLATASLFGGGRVVVVQGADALDATGRQAVLAAARDPSPGTVLVLRAGGVGRQARFFKDLQQHAQVVTAARLKPSERTSWLRAEVRRFGRKADEAAVTALLDTVGHDLRELAAAVAKLHVAVPPPEPLRARHVTAFLTQTADRGVFELTDAVFAGDAATALGHLESLLAQGEDVLGLLGMLARQLRLLLKVSEHPNTPAGQVAQAVGGGVRDWQVDRARRQARKFQPEVLRRALDLIAEADAEVRNGSLPSRLLLELVVARVASAGAPAAGRR
ncbi:MAG TPA: DNA polymerase III subunit delta [Actinomycetota bacterium]|jgi:DNA polymerase-3 subunit delta|nr:DNA polymerase III subunit delta [Actinomycetota bacterium]